MKEFYLPVFTGNVSETIVYLKENFHNSTWNTYTGVEDIEGLEADFNNCYDDDGNPILIEVDYNGNIKFKDDLMTFANIIIED